MVKNNNLFKYATSELSQDAFICWLLSHASEDCWNENVALRECALKILKEIFKSKNISFKESFRVNKIETQKYKIDVLVTIDRYRIIIEDKTFTSTHNNQISNYKQSLIKANIPEEDIFCVYYKIIEQAQKEKNIDCEFTREGLLAILLQFKERSSNPIFSDYCDYLETIQSRVDAYRILPIEKWSNDAYRGFFKYLSENELIGHGCNWNYVSNASGGFMGLWWWNTLSLHDIERIGLRKNFIENLYIQIQGNQLAIKLYAEKKNEKVVKDIRWKLFHHFRSKIGKAFIKGVFRPGNTMTVGYVKYDFSDYKAKLDIFYSVISNLQQDDFLL